MPRPDPIMRHRRPDLVDRARTPAPIDSSNALPTGAWAEILGLSQPDTVKVTDSTVRGLPALNRAKAMVVNATASMLVAAQVFDHGLPVEKPLVVARPHPLLTAVEFYRQVVDSLVMHGNYVAVVAGDQLIPVPLGAVSVDNSSGLPVYTIGKRTYSWREILHIRHQAPTGTWWGVGVVEQFRKSLSEHLHGQAYGEASFRTGAVPSLVVQLDIPHPTEEQVSVVKEGLMDKLGGGRREPLVYGTVLKNVTPVGWSPQDAEFVMARQMSYAEACWLVGLKPDDIGVTIGSGGGASISYGNRTDDAMQRVSDAYGPWMELVEQAMSDLLGAGVMVLGNPDALTRTSTRERLEIRQLAQAIGIETPEESKAEEGQGPITTVAEQHTETETGILEGASS